MAHCMVDKLHSIYKSCTHVLSPNQQIQMNSIDKVKRELMVNAEFRCQKLCMGEIDFSPDFHMAWSRRYCWSMVIHKCSVKKVSSRKIKTLAQAVGIEKPLSITLRHACKHWKVGDKAYWVLKKHAPILRQDFLHDWMRDTQLSESQQKHETITPK